MMSFRSRFRALALFTVAGLLAVIPFSARTAASQRPSATQADYPYRNSLWRAESEALLLKAAAERRFERIGDTDVITLLSTQGRAIEALLLARETSRTQPEMVPEIAAVLSPLVEMHWISDELLPAFADTLSSMRPTAEMPHEAAARSAYALVDLEFRIDWWKHPTAFGGTNRPRRADERDKPTLLRAILRDFPGTPEAELAELDLVFFDSTSALTPANSDFETYFAALEKFGRDHSGTVAGAKALYLFGEAKAQECCGNLEFTAPDRLKDVLRVITELTSGKFPPCEWVDRAASLIRSFKGPSWLNATPETADRTIAIYKEFVLAQLNAPSKADTDGVEHILFNALPTAFRLRELVDGKERTLDELLKEVKNPGAVRELRAQYDSRPMTCNNTPQTPPPTLTEIGNRPADASCRQPALAGAAEQRFSRRDYKAAIDGYRVYLNEFPESNWAWIAAMRIAEAQAESRNYAQARESFHAVATAYASRPVARAIACAFAAQTSAALGDFEAELTDLKLALEAWEPALGPSFKFIGPDPGPANFFNDEFPLFLSPRYEDGKEPVVLSPSLRRETLAVRANALSISLAQPNGAEFELARWRADHGEWDRAIATLQPLAKDPKSAFHSEAERLARRARLERALSWIDVAAARRDEKGAAREFESLASDGKDFTAVAARIARAALALKQSKQDEARRWMREGLEAWRKNQQSDPAAAKGSLEEDVTAIRNLVIRRLDDAGPYLLATSVTPVRFAAGNTAAVVLSRPLPQLPNALFLNEEREMFLVTLMKRFGVDPEKNSPPIDAEEQKEFPDRLPAFMQKFFPITIGPFSQWVFFTSAITQIEFTDEQGANATVFMTYDKLAQFRFRPGMGTLAQKLQDIHLEKRNGVWRVIETRSWQEGEGG